MTTEETCKHIWKIDDASGPTSHGVCRKCGNERHFENSMPDGTEADRQARRRSSVFRGIEAKEPDPDLP